MKVAADAPRYRVPALERGLQILQMFDRERSTLSPPEIARDLRLPRTTVFRLLQTLEDLGYVERVDARCFRVGTAVHRQALESLAMLGLARAASDLATQLHDRDHCLAQPGVRDRSEALAVCDAAAPGPCDGGAAAGRRTPAPSAAASRG